MVHIMCCNVNVVTILEPILGMSSQAIADLYSFTCSGEPICLVVSDSFSATLPNTLHLCQATCQ